MKNLLMAVVFVASSIALAAPAAAPAPAAKAKAHEAAPAAAAVAVADCDMHKAEAQFMKEVGAMKGVKMEMIKLENGTTGIITADAKSVAGVEKSMTPMQAAMKDAMDGKGKICDKCQGALAAMKAGKAMMGMGHQGAVWTKTTLSSDPEMVKAMHAEVDAHAAPAAKK